MKKLKQQNLFDEKEDPEVARIADRFVELLDEKRKTNEQLDVQQRNLIGMLHKKGKERVRHKGFLIRVTTSKAKEKLVVKPVSPKKDVKGR